MDKGKDEKPIMPLRVARIPVSNCSTCPCFVSYHIAVQGPACKARLRRGIVAVEGRHTADDGTYTREEQQVALDCPYRSHYELEDGKWRVRAWGYPLEVPTDPVVFYVTGRLEDEYLPDRAEREQLRNRRKWTYAQLCRVFYKNLPLLLDAADEADKLRAENQRLRRALESARDAVTLHPRDWSLHHRDAWVYGILVGWGSALSEVAEIHRWTKETLDQLKTHRRALERDDGQKRG